MNAASRALGAWIATRSRWQALGLAVLPGGAAGLSVGPFAIWPVVLGGFFLAMILLAGSGTVSRAGWVGWGFGTGYFAAALLWIVEPFLVDVARHGWMAPFALVFLSGGLALFWAAAFGLAHWVGRGATGRVLALVVTLSLTELARAYVLTGFPWASPVQVWVHSGVGLTLAALGAQGLWLVTLILIALPVLGLRRHPALILPALIPLAGFVLWADVRLASAPISEGTGQVIRMVQPNARQDQKWNPAMIPLFFQRQIGFTSAAPRPDLILWPETALPTLLNHADEALAVIAKAADGVPVVLGVQRYDQKRFYNSLILLDGTGQVAGLYDKHHLVPFGEYIPLGDLAARFGLTSFAAQYGNGYSAGPGPRLLDLGALGKALPLICYEAVFAQDVNNAPARPDLLLQLTNDAWFGELSGPYQHLAQARMRAIEQGLPMVRVANTGVSAMIDPLGRVTASLPLGTDGFLDAELPAPLPETFYARSGDGPVAGLLFLLLLGFCGDRALTKRRKTD